MTLWRGFYLCLLAVLLIGCNPFAKDEGWIYAQTPVPAPHERGGKPLIVTVGDSIAAGWQVCSPTPCHGIELDWWQSAFAGEAIVLSRGVGNSTTSDLLARWEQDTAGADVIFILTGVNDVARGVPPETILKNFEAMHHRAQAAEQVAVFSTIMPADSTDLNTEIETAAAVNAALRQKTDWYVMDLAAAMADPTDPNHLRRDEIAFAGSAHPNAKGYGHMADFVRGWWAEQRQQILAECCPLER